MKRTPLQRRATLRQSNNLKPIGKRGKRLASGDRAIEALVHDQPCICGCSADPYEGEVCRVHLESRAYAETRNEPWNNLPGDMYLNRWLDSDPMGVQCRAVLLEMAHHKWEHHAEVLIHADVWSILDRFGYYSYRAKGV